MKKKPFTLATTLLTFSTNICFFAFWQLPSNTYPAQTRQNKHNFSLINKQKSKIIPNQNLATNPEFSQVNKLESNNLNSVALPKSEIKNSPSSPIQIAHQALRGQASWYGPKFHGRRTANGEIFNSNALTAAHRSLPFGTKVKVTNMSNGRSVVVRINDRGPFTKGRIIDLSAGAARVLNMINSGVAPVQLEILGG